MTSDPTPLDDDNFPTPADYVARRRLWTFIIVIAIFSAWLRFEWSQGGITPLFGPLHLAVHESRSDAGAAIVFCAVMLPLMFSYLAHPSWVTTIGSVFFTLAWLFYGFFWWTSSV
jgi:hypothetical protein